jgi:hypothetical protein
MKEPVSIEADVEKPLGEDIEVEAAGARRDRGCSSNDSEGSLGQEVDSLSMRADWMNARVAVLGLGSEE